MDLAPVSHGGARRYPWMNFIVRSPRTVARAPTNSTLRQRARYLALMRVVLLTARGTVREGPELIMYYSGLFTTIAAAAFITGLAAQTGRETPKPQLTARELFYKAPAKPAEETPAPKAVPKVPSRPKQQAAVPPPTGQVKAPAPPQVNSPAGGAAIIQAAQATAGPPLGLKYSIIKTINKRPVGEVSADSTFQVGDGVQLKVETNVAGYLYIINQGSSGTWKPMFPSPEIAGGNNRVQGFQTTMLPSGEHQMTFHEPAGVENLFIVFSREPVSDLEDLIYSLQDKSKPAVQPEVRPTSPNKEKVVMAMAKIDDSVVGRLRQTYSRDLVIEKVSPEVVDSSAKKETAVYVVNPTGSADSRLVADIKLRHQ